MSPFERVLKEFDLRITVTGAIGRGESGIVDFRNWRRGIAVLDFW